MITWILEIYLNYYRRNDRRTLLATHGDEFLAQEPGIIKLLKITQYYHGTGARHYHYGTESKYGEAEPVLINTLARILEDGIQPQRDLFNKEFQTGTEKSISLTKHRIYARSYAQLFLTEGTELQYEYGQPNVWYSVILLRIYTGILISRFSTRRLFKSRQESWKKVLIRWTRSFRQDGKYEGSSLVRCMNGRSDIPHNFGIVIGIKQDKLEPLTINYPNISKDEIRVAKPIQPTSFSHIQAPLRYIHTVKEACQAAGLDIPVIPLEFVELHNQKVGLRKLHKLARTGKT